MILTLRLKDGEQQYLGPGKEMAAATFEPKLDTGTSGQQESR